MSTAESPTPASSSSHGSYASRQKRFGPAPLASFEDLPTDEQSSSEDEKSSSVRMICPQISFLITDHNETIAPLEVARESITITNAPNSLGSPQITENKRKGSWTDLFSMRKSPTPTKSRERKFSLFNFKFFNKDLKNDSECELQNLGSTTSLHNSTTIDASEQQEINIEPISPSKTTDQVSGSSDLTPTNVESTSFSLTVVEIGLPNLEPEEDNQTIVESRSLHSGSSCSLDQCCETETDCAECRECQRISITCHECNNDSDCCNAADNEDNDEETERNLVSDDCELECLLTGDELEQNSHLNVEPPFRPICVFTSADANKKLNFQLSTERLKTSPIERPHSITPINVNSFEAYINQFTPDNVDNFDRLTIKLPGLHSNQRNRFTRKSNPYIWQEFCEKGLKSPQLLRKRANSCFPEINQNCYLTSAFDSIYSPENLTPITPIKGIDGTADRFDDNFWDYLNRNKSVESSVDEGPIKVALSNLGKLQLQATGSCSCECNSSVTSNTAYNLVSLTCSEISSYSESSDNVETGISVLPEPSPLKSEFNEDQPLVSPCDCACHRTHSLNQFSLADLSTSLGTNVYADSRNEAVYDSRNTEDDDLSQLSSSTLSSTSSSATSASQSIRFLDTSATSNV